MSGHVSRTSISLDNSQMNLFSDVLVKHASEISNLLIFIIEALLISWEARRQSIYIPLSVLIAHLSTVRCSPLTVACI